MFKDLFQMSVEYINIVFLVFALVLFTLFTTIGYLSSRSSLHYRKKHSIGDLSNLLDTPLAPSITIIAPAYNESLTIVENVRSLLALRYGNYDIMVVNDGSEDDTLKRLIEAYDLFQTSYDVDREWPSKPIKAIYKSRST
ncbi:glycosyltransferase family 2 protein, partial [Robiginitalea sp.]|uniref:glycosyltransferase n=1 Tax=Robiginitalea sp. TaxID=1902411 RepID=UPI003C509805